MNNFTNRLEKIFDYYAISASIFADKIGVQRSSLSHLLSGRNKPSLDFIIKIVETFKEVDLDWIIFGKGNFPKNDIITNAKIEKTPTLFSQNNNLNNQIKEFENNTTAENQIEKKTNTTIINSIENEANFEIEKIVIFYKNGTFKLYNSK